MEVLRTVNKTWFVYKHTCPNGKVYVGITCKKKLNYRWENGTGYLKCTYFNHAIKKYGWDNIKHEVILENVSKEEAVYTEKYLIRWYKIHKISYNLTDGGDGVTGVKCSEETKAKLSKANKGRKLNTVRSPELRQHLAEVFSKPILQLNKITLEVIAEHPSIKQAAINLGHEGKETNIAHVLHNRHSTAFGYSWKFKE